LSRTRTGRGAKRQTLYFLTIEMKSKFLKFKNPGADYYKVPSNTMKSSKRHFNS
jgi:hypothetical protein